MSKSLKYVVALSAAFWCLKKLRQAYVRYVAKSKQPSFTIIGGGFSGILMGIKLKEMGIDDFTIIEKNSDIGGTWLENVYPNCACDVESVFYSYSFELNPDWTKGWSVSAEIRDYAQRVARKYGLYEHVRLNTEVVSASWDDDKKQWNITTRSATKNNNNNHSQEQSTTTTTITSLFLISATGQLNYPKYPDIKGRESFAGESFHSARWKTDCDLTGKNVGVIGNAASAVQFLPSIVKDVGKLTIYQRSPNWVAPKLDWSYHENVKAMFRILPFTQRLYRWLKYWSYDIRFGLIRPDSYIQREWLKALKAFMPVWVPNEKLRKQLTPEYNVGCKRVLIANGFFECIQNSKTTLVTEPIVQITDKGVITLPAQEENNDNNKENVLREHDVLIYATGFETNKFLHPIEVIGRDGQTLKQVWGESPHAYKGITVPNFPNMMMLYGPNTNLGHSSVIFMMECQAEYIIHAIGQALVKGKRTLEVKEEVEASYNEKVQKILAVSVWADSRCTSWYKNKEGKIVNNSPFSTTAYWLETRRADLNDFNLESGDFARR